jgi:hypothetical protein
MVELYGLRTDYAQHRVGESFEPHEVRDLVAVFDTEQMAMDYVKNSELTKPKHGYEQYYDIYRKKFRYKAKSVLRHYTDHEITSPDTISVPVNPSL